MRNSNCIIAFSDIDGTLIKKLSDEEAKRQTDLGINLIPISRTKNGCSYMTKKQHEKLMQIVQQIDFVPVTSRAKESYDLVDFGFVCKHALVEGGSVLLVDGNVDAEWKSEIDAMVQTESDLFPEIKKTVSETLGFDIKYDNDYLLDFIDREYVASKDKEEKSIKYLATKQSLEENPRIKEHFNIYASSNGMYLVHKKLEKGEMLKKYTAKYGMGENTLTISMGDSKTDSTMFKVTQDSIGVVGSGAQNIFVDNGQPFGFIDFILDTLEKRIQKINK